MLIIVFAFLFVITDVWFDYESAHLASIVARSKAHCFELVLRDAALVRFPLREEFSASVWDRCQFSIERNFDSY